MEMNTRRAREWENRRRREPGGSGPLTEPAKQVSQQMSDNACETQKYIAPSSESPMSTSQWPSLTRQGQRRGFWEMSFNLDTWEHTKPAPPSGKAHSSAPKSPPHSRLRLLQGPCPSIRVNSPAHPPWGGQVGEGQRPRPPAPGQLRAPGAFPRTLLSAHSSVHAPRITQRECAFCFLPGPDEEIAPLGAREQTEHESGDVLIAFPCWR